MCVLGEMKSVVGVPVLYNGLTNILIYHKNSCVRQHSEAEGKVGQVRNFREDFLVAHRDMLECYSCPH